MTRLDAIDWMILKELQGDGRMTNVELARRVGISAPPCLRRVRALEEAGFIKGYRALLDEKLRAWIRGKRLHSTDEHNAAYLEIAWQSLSKIISYAARSILLNSTRSQSTNPKAA